MQGKLIYVPLAISLILSSAAAQQPVGEAGGTPPTRRGAELPTLEPLTADITGEVLQIDTERNAIQIRNKRTGKELGLLLDAKCKIRGDKKQFGKKELTLADLEAGHQVELTIRRADFHVLEMRVKKPKEKAAEDAVSPPKN